MSRLGQFVYCSILMAVGASSATAQGGQSAFVYLVGMDTIGVERFAAGSGVSGEVVMRGQPRMTYLGGRGGGGRIEELYVVVYPPGSDSEASPMQSARMRLVGDTVFIDITAGGSTRTQRLGTQRDAFLLINSSLAMLEVAVERLQSGRDTVSFPVFLTGGGQTMTAKLQRVSADSLVMQMAGMETSLILRGGRLVRVRNPAQRLVAERVDGPAAARISIGRPDYSAPSGAPYRAEHVTIPVPAGHVLAGTLTVPQGAGARLPAVVTITGSGPQDRDEFLPLVPGFRPFRQVADTLGRRGIIVLRLDDRGTGESTGDFSAATSADFADDVRAAIAWLRARPDVDPAKIALLGHSEGGLIAPMVAATDARLAGIVLMAGPSKRGRDILDYQLRYGVDHDSTVAPAKRDSVFAAIKTAFDTSTANLPWMKFFIPYDPMPTIRQVKVPVLILNGATDQQVTADQAEVLGAALRQAGNRDVTVRVYPDRNHLFLPDPVGNPAGYVRLPSGKIGPEVMGAIAEWLAARLKGNT
ncbi:MAG: alpha/beta hydrolase family protein [Longimicrobiales bacterium]